MSDNRGFFHCRIREGGAFRLLCGEDTNDKVGRAPNRFMELGPTMAHWWDDGTYWEKCPICVNHPDLSLHVLGDLDNDTK